MIGKTAERLQNFIGGDEKPSWWYLVGTGVSILFAIGCWMQTGLYVHFYVSHFDVENTSYSTLQTHIKTSQGMQAKLARARVINKATNQETKGNITYLYFDPSEQDDFEAALTFIRNDDELNQKLTDRFKTSLREVRAVVAPIWKTDDPGYCEDLGITREGGRADVNQSSKSDTIGAATVRDRPGVSQRTLDGTPRILINPNALAYTNWTRRVVFHEMMHAMNLPAYSPPLAWTRA